MARRGSFSRGESFNLEDNFGPELEGFSRPAGDGLGRKAFNIVKLLLGLCLLPLVYSASASFLAELSGVDQPFQDYFWGGLASFILLHLFIWEPAMIYARGQKLLSFIFMFFKPLVKVAPNLLPVYAILVFALYGIASLFNKGLEGYFIFFFAFFLALHLVFSARSMRARQGDFLKANYIFGFSFTYVLDIILSGFLINTVFPKFSFVKFFNDSYQGTGDIFYAVFKQLFLR